jgi:hypothetical protein
VSRPFLFSYCNLGGAGALFGSAGFRTPVKQEVFSLPHPFRQTLRLTSLLCIEFRGIFPEIKRTGRVVDHRASSTRTAAVNVNRAMSLRIHCVSYGILRAEIFNSISKLQKNVLLNFFHILQNLFTPNKVIKQCLSIRCLPVVLKIALG